MHYPAICRRDVTFIENKSYYQEVINYFLGILNFYVIIL